MASDRKPKQSNSIPIRFFDSDQASLEDRAGEFEIDPDDSVVQNEASPEKNPPRSQPSSPADDSVATDGGPALAELLATRAELKRLQAELSEAQDAMARRQADFENYRKRIDRERGESRNRIIADLARKLLPVVDNLTRALEAERSMEANESKEFKHFLHGVELIGKQLNEVLESLGVEPIAAVGERFDPHVHEAVVTESTNEFEPDTVIQEMARGYRIGDKLVRPAMVKVAAKSSDDP
jgi:molecular chaperone GrpE